MAGGVSDYAAANARARIMYSALLDGAALSSLLDAPDVPALVEQLRRTAYASEVEGIRERNATGHLVVMALKRRLASSYMSLIRAVPGQSRRLLLQLYRRHEIGNLKATLRAVAISATPGSPKVQWRHLQDLLFPMGPSSVVPCEAMLEAGTIAGAIELLRGSPYYEVLTFALKRYTAEQSLFPLEVALDLYYWRQLWQEARKLPIADQGPALRIVGSLVDVNNLMWVIRYKMYQALSEEEVINYTLPFGYRLHDEDIRAMAAGGDIGVIISRLFPAIPNLGVYLEAPTRDLPGLETELGRHVVRQCLAAFVGNPFHIGVPLAYLVLQDFEIQDLVVLLEGKASDVPDQQVRSYLLRNDPAPH